MNAREALQALLDGKTLIEKFPRRSRSYRLNGDKIEHTLHGNVWEDSEDIPMICLDFTHIQEVDE